MSLNATAELAEENRLARLLIVEDDPEVRGSLLKMLEGETCACEAVEDGVAALEHVQRTEYDVILSDLRMPRMDGMALLRRLSESGREATVLIITAHGDIDLAVEATRLGAYDFLCKPVSRQNLRLAVARALEHQRLIRLNRRLTRRIVHAPTFGNLIGKSPAMMDVFRLIAQVAPTNANVLITGESGTGKEEAARALHAHSRRRERRFSVVDCTAIPENLMESILFGHQRGAFTGAEQSQVGLLGLSDGGTVFFDEIGELPLHLQSKLLRVLQTRRFIPVGAGEEVEIDVRVVAATNRDLAADVRAGRFREDLFYRLNVVPLHMPPLRERGDDVLDLALHFLDKFSEEFPHINGFAPEALRRLRTYSWPGNVRELRNAVERAVSLATSEKIQPGDLPDFGVPPNGASSFGASLTVIEDRETFLRNMERDYLTRLLIHYDGNVSQAAKHAGVSRKTFYKNLRDAGLDAEDFRTTDGEPTPSCV